jgi:hypothetical protein
VEKHVGACDGTGGCGDVPKTCGAYECGPTTCLTSCSADTDCVAGRFCKSGTCVPKDGLGKTCSGPTGCSDGLFCTDGFCCGVDTCGAGSTCGAVGKEGTCTKLGGAACTADVDCGTGHCADGVCCDTACDGQCEACDVPDSTTGRPGKCIPVKGKPHGTKAACAGAGGDVCAAAACDGSVTTSCASFTGSDTECRPQSCKDGVLTARAVCDGSGKCPALVTSKCDGFQCTTDGKGCLSRCASDTDCLPDYVCAAEKCAPKTATCSPDFLSSIATDGTTKPCAPYRCGTDGRCTTTCGTTDDCAPGNVCQDGACAGAADGGGTNDSGGCATTSRSSTLGGGALLALLAGAALASRRRRAS